MDLTPLFTPEAAFCAATVFAVAVLRGFTGFGFAVVAVPLLSLTLEPVMAVPLVLLLEVVASLQLLPRIWRDVQWRAVGLLAGGALLGTPLGLYVLSILPATLMRLLIAGVVLATALLLSMKLRFQQRPGMRATLGTGLISGLLNGGAAISGPPVILYFLASPASLTIGRASLVLYFLLTDLAGAGLALLYGLITEEVALLAGFLLLPLFMGQVIGARMFHEDRQSTYRLVSIVVMTGAGLLAVLRAAYAE